MLSDHERIAIEDHFFRGDVKVKLPSSTTAVVVAQNKAEKATLQDFAVLVEFALGLLTVSGFLPVSVVAALNSTACIDAMHRSYPESSDSPIFANKVKGAEQ